VFSNASKPSLRPTLPRLEEDRRAYAYIHGDDDQIVPIADSAMLTVKLVKTATLKVYPGASHGYALSTKSVEYGPAGIPSGVDRKLLRDCCRVGATHSGPERRPRPGLGAHYVLRFSAAYRTVHFSGLSALTVKDASIRPWSASDLSGDKRSCAARLERVHHRLRSKKYRPVTRSNATELTRRAATTSPVVVQSTDTSTFPSGPERPSSRVPARPCCDRNSIHRDAPAG